jgi:hypothetical protein
LQVAGLDSLRALQGRPRYADRLPLAGEPIAFVHSRSRLIHDRNVQVMLADELGKKVGLLRLKAPACPMRSPAALHFCTMPAHPHSRLCLLASLLPPAYLLHERVHEHDRPTHSVTRPNPPGCFAARPKRSSLALHDARMQSQP